MDDIFEKTFLGNSVQNYLTVLTSIALGLWLAKLVIGTLTSKMSRQDRNTWSGFAGNLARTDGLGLIRSLIIYEGFKFLHFQASLEKLGRSILLAFILFRSIKLISKSVSFVVENNPLIRSSEKKSREIKGLILIINTVLWSLGLAFFLYNQGYNVTAILTGLGIGGLAIALASQTFLVDIFNYFVIFFDKPFEIGDFIGVDDKKGTVEYIGLKTTRLASLTGEQIIFANADIAKARIHNFKRMKSRTVIFHLKLSKNTPIEHLKVVPKLIKEIITPQSGVVFDHATFSDLGEFSFDFEVVYVVENPDDHLFVEVNQFINFAIVEALQKNNIQLASFPYPDDAYPIDSIKGITRHMSTSNSS